MIFIISMNSQVNSEKWCSEEIKLVRLTYWKFSSVFFPNLLKDYFF